MSAITAIGTMAFDTIETPFGKVEKILGGSANYFSLSASYFVPVQTVSLVGEDFPRDHLSLLNQKGVDTQGIRIEKGKTFHWTGRYGYDLNEALTLSTCLNVFEKFEPDLPPNYRKSPFVFLGNIAPQFQAKIHSQMEKPKFVALDTMNFWIESNREDVISVLSHCDALLINEAEVRQLTKVYNVVEAARIIRQWGPQILVVKRGEYGALLFDHGDAFGLPGLPLQEVKDPTGAGDSFAGGFLGYLASQANFSVSRRVLRHAVVYGSVMASFTVQDFGIRELLNLKKDTIEDRFRHFVELTSFHSL